MNPVDVKSIVFFVSEEGGVYLYAGPIGVLVCNSAEEFEDFKASVIDAIEAMAQEIKENYVD